MPVSDDKLKAQLSKYIKDPNTVDYAIRLIDGKHTDILEKGGQSLAQALQRLGVPDAGIDTLLGIADERKAARDDASAKEWEDLTAEPTPDEIVAQAGVQQYVPDLGGFSADDWAQVEKDIAGLGAPAPVAQEPAPAPGDPIEDRFGNDMAWLDDAFQEQQVTTADALQYGTSADPEQEARQKQAINELFDIYQQGGNTAQDRAARAKNRAETENLLAGQSAATMQDMAERGMGGSGAELAAMLANQQGAASRLSQADLQTSADSEARALSALMGGQQAASGLGAQQNQFVQNNAAMLQKTAGSNADWLRQGWAAMKGARDNWDLQTLLAKIGVAQGEKARDVGEQQYGYTHGTGVAGTDAGAATAGQAASNAATLGTFTGMAQPIWAATQTRIGKTGGTQAAAGRSASGGAAFAGNLISSIYGGGGGGGGSSGQGSGANYTPAGEYTGMDRDKL